VACSWITTNRLPMKQHSAAVPKGEEEKKKKEAAKAVQQE